MISTTLISVVSRYTVGQGDFTEDLYDALIPQAQAILDHETNIAAMPTALYDRCHALMVVHLYVTRDPSFGFNSYSAGDYSQSSGTPGGTVYSIQYYDIIKHWTQQNLPQTLDAVQRADVDLQYAKLDGNKVQEYWKGT